MLKILKKKLINRYVLATFGTYLYYFYGENIIIVVHNYHFHDENIHTFQRLMLPIMASSNDKEFLVGVYDFLIFIIIIQKYAADNCYRYTD